MSDWYVLADDGKTPIRTPSVDTDPAGYTAAMHNHRERYDWIVEKTPIRDYTVSTVFLFLDHGWDDGGPPVLWESLVMGVGPWANYQQRYMSRDEAQAGHDTLVQRITDSADMEARILELQREADRLRGEMLGYD